MAEETRDHEGQDETQTANESTAKTSTQDDKQHHEVGSQDSIEAKFQKHMSSSNYKKFLMKNIRLVLSGLMICGGIILHWASSLLGALLVSLGIVIGFDKTLKRCFSNLQSLYTNHGPLRSAIVAATAMYLFIRMPSFMIIFTSVAVIAMLMGKEEHH